MSSEMPPSDDRQRGVYEKFKVERKNGSSGPGGKHQHCFNFVLDLTHDPYAVPAIEAYAEACQMEFPKLARDIFELLETRRRDGR